MEHDNGKETMTVRSPLYDSSGSSIYVRNVLSPATSEDYDEFTSNSFGPAQVISIADDDVEATPIPDLTALCMGLTPTTTPITTTRIPRTSPTAPRWSNGSARFHNTTRLDQGSIANTEQAMYHNSSAMSTTSTTAAKSSASTVLMGSGRNPRERRQRRYQQQRSRLEPHQREGSLSVVGKGLWLAATPVLGQTSDDEEGPQQHQAPQESPTDPTQETSGPLWRQATEEGAAAAEMRRFFRMTRGLTTHASNSSWESDLSANNSRRKVFPTPPQEQQRHKQQPRQRRWRRARSRTKANTTAAVTPSPESRARGKNRSKESQLTNGSAYRFEFGDVVSAYKTQKLKNGDDDALSLLSFSYSEDSEGTGFELDGYRKVELLNGLQKEKNGQNHDDESSESSSCFEGMSKSDRSVFERSISPGAVRLTEDGLSRHEKATFKELLMDQPTDPLVAFKQSHEARKWYRQRLAEKTPESHHRLSLPSNGSVSRHRVGSDLTPPVPLQKSSSACTGASSLGKLGGAAAQLLVNLPFAGRRDRAAADAMDLSNLSLAPVASDEDPCEPWRNTSYQPHKSRAVGGAEDGKSATSGIIRVFRRRSNRSTASSERESSVGRMKEITIISKPDRGSNSDSKPRSVGIEVQRVTKEVFVSAKDSTVIPSSSASSSSRKKPTPDEPVGVTTSMPTTCKYVTRTVTPPTPTSASSSSLLPPCVVCQRAERTHIATPCMHFSFCASCAIRMGDQQGPCHCPVCNEPHVTFAAVSV